MIAWFRRFNFYYCAQTTRRFHLDAVLSVPGEMMTNQEFEQYCAAHDLSCPALAFISRVRASEPARRTGGGAMNVACKFASKKMGFTVQAESQKPEFYFVTDLEFDPDALAFYDQPETLSVRAVNKRGKQRKIPYTPDYLVLSRSEGPILVECKTAEEVNKRIASDKNWWMDKDGSVHYEPLRQWCEECGIKAKVVLSSDIPAKRIQNLQMLADYYDSNAPAPSEEAQKRILGILNDRHWLSIRKLMELDERILADDIHWMVAHQHLYIDFDNQVLADQIRTLLFRDQAAFDAYSALSSTQAPADPFQVRVVNLDVGNRIVWDGKPYSVLQSGETLVFLQDADKRVIQLSLQDADRFIADGVLVAPASDETTADAMRRERVQAASPTDLAIGVSRLKAYQGEASDKPISKRTMERMRQRYRNGERLYGSGYLGLVANVSKRGNRTSRLHPDVAALMKETAENYIFVANPLTNSAALGQLELSCKEKHLTPPGEKTFSLYIRTARKDKLEGAQKGHKAAHQFEPWHLRLTYDTPRHGQRPFEIGHIDHTELDLLFFDEVYGERPIKAWLTVLIDAYSRKILSYHITVEKPSYASAMCVIRKCLEKYGRGCDLYVTDQGAEFNSIGYEALLGRLEAHKKERPAGKARFGCLIERFFGLTVEEFLKLLAGSSQFLKNPRALAPSHDPKKRMVWTLRSFEIAFEDWLETYYHAKTHGTLGVSPNRVFEEGLRRFGFRAHRKFRFDDAMRMLCLPEVKTSDTCLRVDRNHGYVKVHGVQYHGAILQEGTRHRERIFARYDPFDITKLYVYVKGAWQELRSAFAGDLEGYSVKDLHIYTQELRVKHGNAYLRRKENRDLLAGFVRTIKAKEKELEAIKNLVRAAQNQAAPDTAKNSTNGGEQAANNSDKFPIATKEFDLNSHWGITP